MHLSMQCDRTWLRLCLKGHAIDLLASQGLSSVVRYVMSCTLPTVKGPSRLLGWALARHVAQCAQQNSCFHVSGAARLHNAVVENMEWWNVESPHKQG